ncbi:Acyl-CoA--sterol O-acyltransferase 1 [Abeliophyllum distichum]|uniref:Acyl-CoA--sterol O-acyltransferase 1 n=1 Tax=Abeliophyllum distichum TaxID=126358 RepID=A0ABD1R9H1_9LAMI
MFAFGNGPLSDPSLSLSRFLALSCLPIKFQQNPNFETSQKGLKSMWNYALKGFLICLFLKVYDYSDYIHPKVIWVVYSFHIYFGLEIILAVLGGSARAILGIELESQFDEPYLSTSLQDFWGQRWNLMVTRILRPTIYDPVLNASTAIVGRKWASLPAIFGTFMVSGLMHELIFFYMGRVRPDGGITWFFLLHGVSLTIEVAIKKVIKRKWCLPRIISGPLTIGFVLSTSFWLFFPEFLRYNPMERALEEYAALGGFVKDVYKALTFKSLNNVVQNYDGEK